MSAFQGVFSLHGLECIVRHLRLCFVKTLNYIHAPLVFTAKLKLHQQKVDKQERYNGICDIGASKPLCKFDNTISACQPSNVIGSKSCAYILDYEEVHRLIPFVARISIPHYTAYHVSTKVVLFNFLVCGCFLKLSKLDGFS